MSKLGDIQNILEQLKVNINKISKSDILDILQELLNYTVDLEEEALQLLQSRTEKENNSQHTINWESLRLETSPFKINPLHT
jgi:hypothetical protein